MLSEVSSFFIWMPSKYVKQFTKWGRSYSKGLIIGLGLSRLRLQIKRSFNNLFILVSKRDDGKILATASLGVTGVKGSKRNNALVC